MENIIIQKLKCERCDYEWNPRRKEVRVCPKCHSPYWDRKRKNSISKKGKDL
jgi:Zn finger protein HypA/HybF involved in hydrogenase expression